MIKLNSTKVGLYFEKLKTLFLIFLIVLCVVQVGILWSTQSSSFPFLSSLFSDSKIALPVSVEDTKSKYLLPSRIVMSTDFDGDHFVIPNGSKDYNNIWDGAKTYLAQALDSKPQKTQSFDDKLWGKLSASKPYMIEFKTSIPTDIVKWVLNLKPSAGDGLSGIYKIIICPDDPDNGYSDTLYIRDDKNIYTYSLVNRITSLRSEEFTVMYDILKDNPASKNYQFAAEKWGKSEELNFPNDMLGPMLDNTVEAYPSITCSTFSGMDEADLNSLDYEDYEKIASELFGESSSDYDYDRDINGSVVFKRLDIVYRLYKNSVLEYKYTGSQTSAYNLRLLDAYKKAIEFIIDVNKQNNFLSKVNVYLSEVEENSNSYTFKFDYSIMVNEQEGEVPLILKDYSVAKGMDNQENAIIIEANSKRVVHCQMIPVKFKVGKPLNYQWAFQYMYSKAFEKYPELSNKEMSVKNFGVYYVLSNSALKENIVPSFVLYTEDNGRYVLPLSQK
ncbi:hypothetical protein [Ruminiclostridium josui]|uniref:hypothetical protein n=1 Tax=Ruminiclostridium josui TaxID=1499 RepID=UPI0004668669|nr:hypothetical protein [Ruminiclostridium josui]